MSSFIWKDAQPIPVNAVDSEAVQAQPIKDPYLPHFVYNLHKAYMKKWWMECQKQIAM